MLLVLHSEACQTHIKFIMICFQKRRARALQYVDPMLFHEDYLIDLCV